MSGLVAYADPLAAVTALPGVGAAVAQARDAVDALLRHPVLRTDAARVAGLSAARGARASAALSGGDVDRVADPVLQGALRATREVTVLARTWRTAPAQALARLHLLAARDLPGVDPASLGRPRPGADLARLGQVSRLAAGSGTAGSGAAAPAVVVAAVLHGELLALQAFGSADGVVARAAERVVLVGHGLDRLAVGVPEVGHLAAGADYRLGAQAYAEGGPAGLAGWVRQCAQAYARGAEEGLGLCAGEG